MFGLLKILVSIAFAPFRAFLRLSITEVKTTVRPVDAEILGAMPTQTNIVQLITNLKQNASPVFGNSVVSRLNPDTAALTYTAAQLLSGVVCRQLTVGIATQDSTDNATNIVNAIPGAVVGQTFQTIIANLTSAALTVAAGTGVTIAGSNVISRFTARLFVGQVTGSAAVTLTNAFHFGTSQANNL